MYKNLRKLAVIMLAVFLPFAVIVTRAQQIQCADVIKRILQETGDRCKDVGRNKGCYGNDLIVASPADGVPLTGADAFKFNAPGDLTNLADLASLRLAALKEGSDEWGVGYLRVQANFPDSAPGQFVTMLLFGDTSIEDKSKQVSDTSKTPQKSMQAVYFRTGGGALACKGAPTSGLILQTPKGATRAELTLNEVKLSVGSTVFIESPDDRLAPLDPNAAKSTATPTLKATLPPTNTPKNAPTRDPNKHKLVVITIEGDARITVGNRTVTARTGQKVEVPLVDDNSRPAGFPSDPVDASLEISALLSVFVQTGVTNSLLVPTATPLPTVAVVGGGGAVAVAPSTTPLKTNTPGLPAPSATPIPPTPTSTPGLGVVSNTNDNGPGSLRQAILDIPNGGTVTFALPLPPPQAPNASKRNVAMNGPSSIITLFSTILIDKSMTINGTGAQSVGVDGAGTSQLFFIETGNVTFNGLTLSGGDATNGGAIEQGSGTLTINGVRFVNNMAASNGGAVYAVGSVTIRNSYFSGNSAGFGAVYGSAGSNVSVTNSTFSGNTASLYGGGLTLDGSGSLTHVTITGNNGYIAGGLQVYTAGAVTVRNSIISGNSGAVPNINNAITSGGYNLVDDPTGSGGFVGSDLTGIAANLGAAALNGGDTETIRPNAGSPALNAIPSAGGCNGAGISSDQRGTNRPLGGACEIGALEDETALSTNTPIPTPSSTVSASATATASITLTRTNTPFTPFSTFTPTSTATKTATATNTSLPTNTATFTATSTVTNTPTITVTPTPLVSPIPSVQVTNLSDSGPGSLRQAIINAAPGGVVSFQAGLTGTINLASRLSYTKDISISGPGAQSIILFGVNGVFYVTGGTSLISGLTITGANNTNSAVEVSSAAVTLRRVRVINNNTTSSLGGGIKVNMNSLTIDSSEIMGNTNFAIGGTGAGIGISAGNVTIVNSTIAGNSTEYGGGIYVTTAGNLTITQSTFANNSGSTQGGGLLVNGTPTVTIKNSIIAGNTSPSGPNISGNFISGGYNLIRNRAGSNGYIGTDFPDGTNPVLAAANFFGGQTRTIALDVGSPAIDGVSVTGCNGVNIPVDQRGVARPFGTFCDVGAYESDLASQDSRAVINTNDSGAGSLRQALINVTDGGQIIFGLPPGSTIALSTSLVITKNVTIKGPGARLLTITGTTGTFYTSGVTLSLSGMTITAVAPVNGAGIYISSGTVNVDNIWFKNCQAVGYSGGAILLNSGNLNITNSTFSGNKANDGGAIAKYGGLLNVTNSTFYNNQSIASGGGAVIGDGTFTNVTFAGNTAANAGGAIWSTGTVLLKNSIVANNVAALGPDISGTVTSNGYNIIRNTSGATITPTFGDQFGVNPVLNAFGNYGGQTDTVPLDPSSPAINTGGPGCPPTDQRGSPRQDNCDIGAFEGNGIPQKPIKPETKPATLVPTISPTQTPTLLPTFTPSATITQYPTATPSATVTATPTFTPVLPSVTPTATATTAPSATRTVNAATFTPVPIINDEPVATKQSG